jgi:hypothetical protein
MNRLVVIVVGALAVAAGWLVLRQGQLSRRLDALERENALLVDALAQKPDLSKEEFKAVTQRLETAEAFMNAVEGRLTNASMLLTQLQSASRQLLTQARPNVAATELSGRVWSRVDPTSIATSTPSQPSTPASSHSSGGELLRRSWGPEQVVGPPDTFDAGDRPTAWAPRSSQGGKDEWLQVNYDRSVELSEVRVHETYNPGAIAKLVAVLPGGGETMIWEGVMSPGQAPLETTLTVPPGVRAQSIKIYFDRTRAPGWNEIDAVELVARDGTRQWASSAMASSSYADQ